MRIRSSQDHTGSGCGPTLIMLSFPNQLSDISAGFVFCPAPDLDRRPEICIPEWWWFIWAINNTQIWNTISGDNRYKTKNVIFIFVWHFDIKFWYQTGKMHLTHFQLKLFAARFQNPEIWKLNALLTLAFSNVSIQVPVIFNTVIYNSKKKGLLESNRNSLISHNFDEKCRMIFKNFGYCHY